MDCSGGEHDLKEEDAVVGKDRPSKHLSRQGDQCTEWVDVPEVAPAGMGQACHIPGEAPVSQVVEHPPNAPGMRPDIETFIADQALRSRRPAAPEDEDSEPDDLSEPEPR